MMLVDCPVCGKQISRNARQCPHCGEDRTAPVKRRLSLLGYVVVILFVIAWFGLAKESIRYAPDASSAMLIYAFPVMLALLTALSLVSYLARRGK